MSSLDPRALALFDELIDLPTAERTRRLAALAAEDAPLHAAVRALLLADDEHTGLLDRSAVEIVAAHQSEEEPDEAPAGEDPRLGRRLGAWRLDRLIARGGMGDVYEAHRDDDQYQQRVAIKCVRAELASPELVAAFRDERNHLARLDHPGIAALIDGGVEPGGQPWFALRYVEGEPIDRWCDRRRAGLRQRVEALIQAVDALAYAHAQGVLHRDIKPSNLLVDADGRVQLVDFGLSATFEAMAGVQEARIGLTPDYAAPEVLDHAVAGTAADVYALGVLMYRLLSAQWPTPQHSLSALMPNAPRQRPQPMPQRLARLRDPAEANAIARQRGVASAAALARELAGDLSAIALKAVAAQPQDRYASVRAFADDLRRWCEHRPVHARPLGPWAHARKLVRRHRIAAGLSAALLLVLCSGLGIALWQHQRALREAEASHAVSELFASTLGNATLSGLGTAAFSSQDLLDKSESELRKLDLRGQPQLQARSFATLARSYAVIGDYRHADALAAEAQRALNGETDEEGYVAATRLSLLNTRGRYADAARLAQTQLGELEGRHDPAAHQNKVTYGVELALAQWGQGDPPGALLTLDRTLSQARTLSQGRDELTAQLLILRGDFRARLLRQREAEADLKRAIALAEPINPVLADDGLEQLALMLNRGHIPAGLAMAERLLQHRRRTLGERHPKTGRAWVLLGYAQYTHGQRDLARPQILAGQKLIEAAYGHEHPEYAASLLLASPALAGQRRNNVDALREAVGIYERTLGPKHESTLAARLQLAARLHDLPPETVRPSDHLQAERMLEDNIRIKRAAGLPTTLETIFLAHSLLLHGPRSELPRAEALLAQLRPDAPRHFDPDNRYRLMIDQFWIQVRYLGGHRAEADREFARTIRQRGGKPGFVSNLTVHDSYSYRALYAYETCRRGEAIALLERTVAADLRIFGEEGFPTRDAKGYLDNLRRHGRMINTTGAQLVPAYELAEANARAARCGPRAATGP
ncbi:serine/threonine-protein kinase [Lysobacter silvisoli]|uniref:Serine/threonine protein kinase n=1 Tax=Lysobacter silvisoli TaxID=2293254 RepID=A0A371JX32_9GAMM|nr:serine/threonine-protein kinase [Lysobacter silvisoli]RDZ26157.1 serine/threonine protein kinase [Lysobacter silvisoli]